MKNYILNTHDAIIEALENMSNDELMTVHNQFCENAHYMDDQIFNNDEDFAFKRSVFSYAYASYA